MFRRGFWRMGVAGLIGSAGKDSGVTVLARDSNNYVVLCSCATAYIPSGTTSDKYAIGCILINSTTGTLHYNAVSPGGGTVAAPVFASIGYSFINGYGYAAGFATGACGATA